MTFDFIVTTATVLVVSLTAFVVPAMPRWIWPILGFWFLSSGQIDKLHLRPPLSKAEVCTWRCNWKYPSGNDRWFVTRPACLDHCCDDD